MARRYYRRYRRYKRFYRSFKRTLRKNNIFANKSAKSQARQIYALNRKINYIQKRNAPEIVKKSFRFLNFASSQPTTVHKVYLYKDKLFNAEVGNYEMSSDVIRPHSIKFNCVIGLCPHALRFRAEDTAEMSSDYDYLAEQPTTVYFRIILGYVKSGGVAIGNPIVNLGDPAAPIGFQNMSVINGPLVEHFTQNCWLVNQKIIKVDRTNPTKSFVMKLYGKKLMNYQKSVNDVAALYNLGKGELVMWIQTLSPVWSNSYDVQQDTRMPEYFCHIDATMSFVDSC